MPLAGETVTHPCKPIECPMREVGEHTSKLVWEEKGKGAEMEGSAFFGMHMQAACLPGYDLVVDGKGRWPQENLHEAENRLWADLGVCNDHAAFASLEPTGEALGCEPTDGYCTSHSAEQLDQLGLGLMRIASADPASEKSTEHKINAMGTVQCLEGHHYTGTYADLAIGAAFAVKCTSRHKDAKPGVGGGVWLPQFKDVSQAMRVHPLGSSERICAPVACTAPEVHTGSGAVRQGAAELKWGEVATYRCPEGQVMVEESGEQNLVPEDDVAKLGGGKCTTMYAKSNTLEWGAGLTNWRCVADCGKLEDQVPLAKLGLTLNGTGVTHVVPTGTRKYQSLVKEHGGAYGTLSFVASNCHGGKLSSRSARLSCGEDGVWRVRRGEGQDLPVSEVWDAAQAKFVSLDFVSAMGTQLHVLDEKNSRGDKCLSAQGEAMAVVTCDPLAIEQRFDYPFANSDYEEAGLIVSAQTGQCVKLTGGKGEIGKVGGRTGTLALGPCGEHCDAGDDEDLTLCDRGELLAEGKEGKWGPDPDCHFFYSARRPDGTPSEFRANYDHPCIRKKEGGGCKKRGRNAGGTGRLGIDPAGLEHAGVVVNYNRQLRAAEGFSILVE